MSSQLQSFLQAIAEDPVNAHHTWLVLADWLADHDDPRAELVRLQHDGVYLANLPPFERDERIRALLAAGIGPVATTITNSIGMTFVLIPAGTFLMGSSDDVGLEDERPQHAVEISRPFWMGVTPVTQAEYQWVMGKNPSYYCATGGGKDKVIGIDTARFPVGQVSWEDANLFNTKLSHLPEEKQARRGYRLPTEAQWEYACRGGAVSFSSYHCGSVITPSQANYSESGLNRPTVVGSYPANGFGLHDMHGNVWEWCYDVYEESFYLNSPRKDPQYTQSGYYHVLRGGSWYDYTVCRASFRNRYPPTTRDSRYGFRSCFLLDL